MKWIVDRFEGNFAVVECNGKAFDIPRDMLPADLAEGDVVSLEIDKAETEKQKEKSRDLLNKLFGDR